MAERERWDENTAREKMACLGDEMLDVYGVAYRFINVHTFIDA